jgi:hypothetical protein
MKVFATYSEPSGGWSTNYSASVRLPTMIWSLPSARIVRFVLAPILSLWIAGAGCMLGCEGMVAAAATVPGSGQERHSVHHSEPKATLVASGHACSSNGSHSCCGKNSTEPKSAAKHTRKSAAKQSSKLDEALVTVGGSSSGMVSCPLAVSRAAIAAKIRTSDVAAAPVPAHSILPPGNVQEQTAFLSKPLRLPNRGHTYLHCCVFLI